MLELTYQNHRHDNIWRLGWSIASHRIISPYFSKLRVTLSSIQARPPSSSSYIDRHEAQRKINISGNRKIRIAPPLADKQVAVRVLQKSALKHKNGLLRNGGCKSPLKGPQELGPFCGDRVEVYLLPRKTIRSRSSRRLCRSSSCSTSCSKMVSAML